LKNKPELSYLANLSNLRKPEPMKCLMGVNSEGSFLALAANIRLEWKSLPGTNTFICLSRVSAMQKKGFITLTPVVRIIKLFFFLITD